MKITTTFQDHAVWQINNQDSQILVAPDHGARLLTWEVAGEPIIFWPQDADWSHLAGVRGGNPILFPFVARHMVDGVVGRWKDDAGNIYDLPMHGFARDLPFEVIEEPDPHSIHMRLVHTPSTLRCFPFEFVFDVTYRVLENSLEVRFETTNTGDSPLPYYAGHHFYFAVPHEQRPEWRLSLPCQRWGRQNPKDGSVQLASASQTEFTLDDPSLIDRFHLDFVTEQIILEHNAQDRRVVIDLQAESSVPWYAVTTWTQKLDSDFFCIEPWLGLPNAIHHGHGLRTLQSGQKELAVCRIHVQN